MISRYLKCDIYVFWLLKTGIKTLLIGIDIQLLTPERIQQKYLGLGSSLLESEALSLLNQQV